MNHKTLYDDYSVRSDELTEEKKKNDKYKARGLAYMHDAISIFVL
jgi:hypothetical protein